MKFEKGEGEKTITVKLLPRTDRHGDTNFHLEIHSALGATFESTSRAITIQSDVTAVAGTP